MGSRIGLRSWIKGIFATPMHIDDSGDEGAELEADLEEELPAAAADAEGEWRAQTADGAVPGSPSALELEPKTMAFEGAQAEASEKDAEPEKPAN